MKKKKIETSKLLAIYLMSLLTIIMIYAMVVMALMQDLTALPTLITDIAAQILVYAIYCVKSYKGKANEENLKFEREKLGMLEEEEEEQNAE